MHGDAVPARLNKNVANVIGAALCPTREFRPKMRSRIVRAGSCRDNYVATLSIANIFVDHDVCVRCRVQVLVVAARRRGVDREQAYDKNV